MKISTINKYLNHSFINRVLATIVVSYAILYFGLSMVNDHSTKNLVIESTSILIVGLVVYYLIKRVAPLIFIIPILHFVDFPLISLVFITTIVLIEPIEHHIKYEKKDPDFTDFVKGNKKTLLTSFVSFTIFCLASSTFISWLINYLN